MTFADRFFEFFPILERRDLAGLGDLIGLDQPLVECAVGKGDPVQVLLLAETHFQRQYGNVPFFCQFLRNIAG